MADGHTGPANPSCQVCDPATLQALLQAQPTLAALWPTLPRRSHAAGTELLRVGEASTRCWLIEQGLVRMYYLSDQGVARNRSFHAQGHWVAGGLPTQSLPSPCTIEALEPLQTVELDFATLRNLRQQVPCLQPLLEEALGYLFAQHAQREAQLLTLSPEARYRAFLAEHAALLPRLPQHQVASYLGISPVSLSRIRARMRGDA
ncbi:Crp/Fnr family transcriptional regulator [Simplicispira lacusdiani]|uniref:Crp/Fnr family transcriptional regulator n=1 Tax=Simplicispira lacusdiani TaxID=2213010 RepID=UPI001300717C|nr:Crp/Fnr family transcriptional regulator [Simplicispira lacusdiani]